MAVLLLLTAAISNAAGVEMKVSDEESAAYSHMTGEEAYTWLKSLMIRSCPVRVPPSMSKEEAVAKLSGFAPLNLVLAQMKADCESAMAAQPQPATPTRVKHHRL